MRRTTSSAESRADSRPTDPSAGLDRGDDGLIGRAEFAHLVDRALQPVSYSGLRHCVLHVDLDEIEKVDNWLGREARDEAIRQVAALLQRNSDGARAVGRIGEDEFVILLEGCALDRGFSIAQDLRRTIGALNIAWKDRTIKVTVSIGAIQIVPGTGTPDSVLAGAKIACATAKERGRDRVAAFQHEEALRLSDQRRIEIVSHIHEALQNNRFVLYCQLIQRLSARARGRHYEILIRSTDRDGELVSPGQFMAYAEQSEIMPEIDRWVVRRSFDLLAEGRLLDDRTSTVFAINLSGQSLSEETFLEFVIEELERTKVPPTSICFEITETAAILNGARAKEFIVALREYGCLFALDDFGAGLSSFSYLKTLPIDYLKIDGQFVRDIAEDRVSEAIVAAINQMSHAMGVKTIAEYVENDAIRRCLTEIGTDYVQGDGVAKPRPLADELKALAAARVKRPVSATRKQ
jgi:diguanylate cyclase (GGDEF)-like protein